MLIPDIVTVLSLPASLSEKVAAGVIKLTVSPAITPDMLAEAVAETNLSYTLLLAEIETVTGFFVYVTCPVKVIWLLKFTCVSVTSVAVNA